MMKRGDADFADEIEASLKRFCRETHPLPGIRGGGRMKSLVLQIVESRRRVGFVAAILERDVASARADPTDDRFDPVRASIYHRRAGNLDEAFWLVFLFVHFGKHLTGGWAYLRSVYGRLGAGDHWIWRRVRSDIDAFRRWLDDHGSEIKEAGGGFGNHRKYESLSGLSSRGTGAAVASYVEWVSPPRTQSELVESAIASADGCPRRAFADLYRQMDSVVRFGRTAKFDYLTMLAKLRLAEIEPGCAFLATATGPLSGARLLFEGDAQATASPSSLEAKLATLNEQIPVGMQVWEDSLCNWQKSPNRFVAFRG